MSSQRRVRLFRNGRNQAVRIPRDLAIARKLLVRCWAMLRDNQPWQLAAAH
jgi:hypothetical protein